MTYIIGYAGGGPGIGKSTLAPDLYTKLKQNARNVEYVIKTFHIV